jgi:hypothetical protein
MQELQQQKIPRNKSKITTKNKKTNKHLLGCGVIYEFWVIVALGQISYIMTKTRCKDWLAWNQDNVSEWGDMSTSGLLLWWASTIKSNWVCSFKSSTKRTSSSSRWKGTLFLSWYSLFALKQQSLKIHKWPHNLVDVLWFSGEATNTNFIVFKMAWLDRSSLSTSHPTFIL